MRTGAKKRPSYRVVVKEKQSKRDGACLENLGTYNPTREPAEIKLKAERVQYWLAKGAQPTDTVRRLNFGDANVPWLLASLKLAVVSVVLIGLAAHVFRRRFKTGSRA